MHQIKKIQQLLKYFGITNKMNYEKNTNNSTGISNGNVGNLM